jgi:ADP-ribose pyrophosphatase YjhB (NUDIX family)
MPAKFCSACGTKLRSRKYQGRRRPACPSCGLIAFDDPKVAVGVLATRRGKLVLVQRGMNPHKGAWSFPSGFVDAGEGLEEAAIRETKEETGLDIRIGRQLGAFAAPGDRVVFIAYAARVVSGRIAVGRECQDVRYFDPADLPPFAFPHDPEILRIWRAGRA